LTLLDLTPKGVDIFFENTGGPIQQQVFNRMNVHGRIIVCGMISDYVSAQPSPGPNWIPLIKKRVTVRGFAMTDHLGEASKLRAKLAPYVANGKIKFRTHVLEGLESAPEGLNLFFSGGNRGKLMVRL
jgi:NADPH-dependent curcumin reductase CurA